MIIIKNYDMIYIAGIAKIVLPKCITNKTMPYSINPRVDLEFKKIFGVEKNKDLLISLINSTTKQSRKMVKTGLRRLRSL